MFLTIVTDIYFEGEGDLWYFNVTIIQLLLRWIIKCMECELLVACPYSYLLLHQPYFIGQFLFNVVFAKERLWAK